MAEHSKISWCDATWPVTIGCSRVSTGCERCYAERLTHRLAHNPVTPRYAGLTRKTSRGPAWTGEVRCVPEVLSWPLKWRRPRRVFVSFSSDLFHEQVPHDFIAAVFGVMAACPQHVFQILTKRPERMADWLSRSWEGLDICGLTVDALHRGGFVETGCGSAFDPEEWPLPNVHLGVSIENQRAAEERLPLLLETPAAVRWLSVEPLLGPVDLLSAARELPWGNISAKSLPAAHPSRFFHLGPLHWVVCGGESGPRYRPMEMAWARSLRDQCQAAGVPFFFKQQSGPKPGQRDWLEEADGSRWRYQQFPGQLTPPERVEP